jgi:hypothetical protein
MGGERAPRPAENAKSSQSPALTLALAPSRISEKVDGRGVHAKTRLVELCVIQHFKLPPSHLSPHHHHPHYSPFPRFWSTVLGIYIKSKIPKK